MNEVISIRPRRSRERHEPDEFVETAVQSEMRNALKNALEAEKDRPDRKTRWSAVQALDDALNQAGIDLDRSMLKDSTNFFDLLSDEDIHNIHTQWKILTDMFEKDPSLDYADLSPDKVAQTTSLAKLLIDLDRDLHAHGSRRTQANNNEQIKKKAA